MQERAYEACICILRPAEVLVKPFQTVIRKPGLACHAWSYVACVTCTRMNLVLCTFAASDLWYAVVWSPTRREQCTIIAMHATP